MNIVPISIEMKNFLSYQDQTFFFNNGLNLINGSNGSGKTTISEAVLFCLTGKTFKGLKADDVIKDGESSCKVKFNFTANGKAGFILVKRNPNKIIFKVGKYKPKGSLTDLQRNIQDWFGFDYETLTKFIIVGESERHRFSFLGSDDSEKKRLLTKLTNSEVVDKALEINKSKISSLESESSQLNYKIDSIRMSIKDNREERKQNVEEIKKIKDRKGIDKSKFDKLKKQSSNYKEAYLKYRKEFEKLRKDKEEYSDKIDSQISEIEKELRLLQDLKDKELKNKMKFEVKQMSVIKCPKCGFEINDTGKKLIEWEKEIKECSKKISGFEERIKKCNEDIKQIKNYKSSEEYISLIKKLNFAEDKFVTNKKLFEDTEKQLLMLDVENKTKIKALRDKNDQLLMKIENKEKELLEEAKKLKIIHTDLDVCKKFNIIFGKEGFKNYLFSNKMKIIEITVNNILKETGVDIKVVLSGMTKLKSGKINQKIDELIYIKGRKRKYSSLSKGEARRIDLAFILAFGKLISFKHNFNLRIFDEPFGGLDDKGIEAIVDMLRKYSVNKTIQLLSPKNELEKYFSGEEIFTIKNINGSSIITNN